MENLKLLLATDYSTAVMNAERYAIQFTLSTHSALTMVHVYNASMNTLTSKPMESIKTAEEIEKYELNKLEQHLNTILSTLKINKNDIPCECIVLEGNVTREIRNFSKEAGIDFIIAGTHGISGFRKALFGTHTWDMIRKSGIPVLAVPEDGTFTGIKKIVFATERREGEIPAINFLVHIARKFDAEITVLYIANNLLSKEFESGLFEKFSKKVNDEISYKKLNMQIAYYHDIIEGLSDFCTESKADWLVMSPEKPFILERVFMPGSSTTRKMSFRTHTPLFSIPDYYNPEYSKYWELFDLDEKYLNEEFKK